VFLVGEHRSYTYLLVNDGRSSSFTESHPTLQRWCSGREGRVREVEGASHDAQGAVPKSKKEYTLYNSRTQHEAMQNQIRKYRLYILTQVQQEQSLHDESLIAGGAAHVFCGAYGNVVDAGSSPLIVVALTSTGIEAPVLRLKTR
jgi:hypothetical protein